MYVSNALINMYPPPPPPGTMWDIYLSFDNDLVPGVGYLIHEQAHAPRIRLSLLPLSVFSFKRKACMSHISAILLILLSLSSPSARKQFVSYSSVPTYYFRTRLCYLLDCRTRVCLWLGLWLPSKYLFICHSS